MALSELEIALGEKVPLPQVKRLIERAQRGLRSLNKNKHVRPVRLLETVLEHPGEAEPVWLLGAIELLLGAGVDPNADIGGRPPMLMALDLDEEYLAVVEALIRSGADFRSADDEGSTALHMVSGDGKPQFVMLLLRYGADPEARTVHGHRPDEGLVLFEECKRVIRAWRAKTLVQSRAAIAALPLAA
jgi:hypothetical protein